MGNGATITAGNLENETLEQQQQSLISFQARARGANIRKDFRKSESYDYGARCVAKKDESCLMQFPDSFEQSCLRPLKIHSQVLKCLTLTRAQNSEQKNSGNLYVEEISYKLDNSIVSLKLGANNLDCLDFGVMVGKSSDPFLKITRISLEGNKIELWKSSFVKQSLEASWEAAELSLADLCDGDKASSFQVECWDYDGPEKSDFIGEVTTTLTELEQLAIFECPVPLSILIYVVGTRGDVQPFIAFAQALQKDGHRVRLATHAMYRNFVMDQGVEFYPLAGDPTKLSETMVKQGGRLIPITIKEIQTSQENMKMLEDIVVSTWPAATAPDPEGGGPGVTGEPFTAELIISNPPVYGHVHVAEKLGIPLHMFFPQPWVSTSYYPHPLGNMTYGTGPSKKNFFSFLILELMMWEGTSTAINNWRESVLGLEKIHSASVAAALLHSVPFAHMWSPSICPKCPDWPPEVSVTGGFYLPDANVWENPGPPDELLAYLDQGRPPIFVGFGSMVINRPQKLLQLIIEAANANDNDRILIQSGWTDFSAALGDEALPPNIFILGPAPHGWLMPRMGAVVHHGGAGTVAAGLRAGKPTFVCPFFGDQFFWGQLMFERGVGPHPCPVHELTAPKLTQAFRTLREPEVLAKAQELADKISKEDGITGGITTLYRCLEGLTKDAEGKPKKDWVQHYSRLHTVADAFKDFTLQHVVI